MNVLMYVVKHCWGMFTALLGFFRNCSMSVMLFETTYTLLLLGDGLPDFGDASGNVH